MGVNQLRHEDIALRRLLKAEPDEGTYDAAHAEKTEAAGRKLRAELGRRVRE